MQTMPGGSDGVERLSDLDSKLRDLHRRSDLSNNGTVDGVGEEEFVKLVHKAFEDDAKQKLMDGSIHGVDVYEIKADFSKGKLDKLMTGQEWYDRFKSDILANEIYEPTNDLYLEAAKRAAGIEGNL